MMSAASPRSMIFGSGGRDFSRLETRPASGGELFCGLEGTVSLFAPALRDGCGGVVKLTQGFPFAPLRIHPGLFSRPPSGRGGGAPDAG